MSEIKRESKEDEENRSIDDLSDDEKKDSKPRSRTRCSINRSRRSQGRVSLGFRGGGGRSLY